MRELLNKVKGVVTEAKRENKRRVNAKSRQGKQVNFMWTFNKRQRE